MMTKLHKNVKNMHIALTAHKSKLKTYIFSQAPDSLKVNS